MNIIATLNNRTFNDVHLLAFSNLSGILIAFLLYALSYIFHSCNCVCQFCQAAFYDKVHLCAVVTSHLINPLQTRGLAIVSLLRIVQREIKR